MRSVLPVRALGALGALLLASCVQAPDSPPQLYAAPAELDFGDVIEGTTESMTVTLSNPGTTRVELVEVELEGDGLEGLSIEAGLAATVAGQSSLSVGITFVAPASPSRAAPATRP